MTTFFLTLVGFVGTFARGLRDPEFRAIFVLVLSLLATGTIFYSGVEGWSALDSLYFSVTTLSTCGFGDLHPTTPLSKAFTILYIILGIGVLMAFLTKLSSHLLESRRSRRDHGSASGG
jgi:voltage-gated potassium channel